ncbi:MAG: tetratricopeptide repeat protein [Chloroflexia bacterium]|nr:tetratricopeptide repeat protein [Chloroflexia bacterium]
MRWLFLLSLLLVVSGCTAAPRDTPLHVLVDLDGQAEVKRSGWTSYALAHFGTMLHAGDELRVSGSATIVCSDLQRIVLHDHHGAIPCGEQAPMLFFHGLEPVSSADPHGDAIPRMITPVRGYVLNDRPLIRWTPAHAAEGYRITLLRGATLLREATVVWERDVGAVTSMAYPDEEAALVPGVAYQFVVAVTNDLPRSSQQVQSFRSSRVRLLSDRAAAPIRAATQQIVELDLDQPGQTLLLTTLYAQQQLHTDVLALLAQGPDEPVFLRQRGAIYQELTMTAFAEDAYQQALAQAVERHDQEGQALAHRVMSRLALDRGDIPAAREHVSAALEIYRQFGATDTVHRLEASLAAWSEQ